MIVIQKPSKRRLVTLLRNVNNYFESKIILTFLIITLEQKIYNYILIA